MSKNNYLKIVINLRNVINLKNLIYSLPIYQNIEIYVNEPIDNPSRTCWFYIYIYVFYNIYKTLDT